MTPRRILLLAYQLGIGGSERQLTEVAKSLDPARFEPHVGCLHRDGIRGDELNALGVPIVSFDVRSFASLHAVTEGLRLTRLLRRRKFDLVHAFDVPMNVFAVPCAKLAGTPVVLSSQRAHRDLTSSLYRRALRLTDSLVDGIVVNCEYMRRHLADDEKVAPGKIHLCYNGVDTAVFRPSEAAAARDAGSLTIGVVCSLRPEKGLPTLLHAFTLLQPQYPGARLLLVGGGPLEAELQQLANDLGIAHNTRFVPTQSNVADWLRQIDIFVLPSLSEALSNALMEAMACGCACVASNVGGNPELLGDGRGLLFESGDVHQLLQHVQALAGDEALRGRLRSSALRWVSDRFTREASVKRMTQIYDSFPRRTRRSLPQTP